ncbi:hypothetical protein [Flavobacterium capsici]|uniref:DUF4369 domain-containing protein n=1 Tax=Flavobacterium capsici TaxID=3075618 RepID=A0AA96J4S0_9FLAO|nr:MULTISPECIES: hypothetical protein [unclassified Flavobacterium]WNM19474.1 hypothetical protein RN608_02045 [Flavobacterium sp. PMR2A8]WNM20863.1 hypothetical protein RN605_09215 [Flavobacterium sp. PMTSA4]
MKKITILLVFILSAINSTANQSYLIQAKNGRVNMFGSFSYRNEKANKLIILGSYVNLTMRSLKLNKKIDLSFYERPKDSIEFHFTKNERTIKIRIYAADIDFEKQLINIFQILNQSNGNKMELYQTKEIIKQVLQNKIYRPDIIKELDKEGNISYYVSNNKFYFYKKEGNNVLEIKSFDNIIDFFNAHNDKLFIVINDNEIIYVNHLSSLPIVKSILIDGVLIFNRPLKLYYLSDGVLVIDVIPFSIKDGKTYYYNTNSGKFLDKI